MEFIKTDHGEKYDSIDLHIKNGDKTGFGYLPKKREGICLIRCPECERENYAMAVTSGVCAWCSYDLNKEFNTTKSNE